MNSSKKKDMKEILCCPVCESLPSSPVFGCQNGHVICNQCKSKVNRCAVCRSEFFNVRNLIVEDLLATNIIKCQFETDGCQVPPMTGAEYTAHVQVCPYRPIECDNKNGISSCQSEIIPFHAYLEHLVEFHAATSVSKKSVIVSCDMKGTFSPKYFQCFNKTFVLYSHRNETRFWSWVALLNNDHTKVQYYIKLRLFYRVMGQPQQSLMSDVFNHFSIRDSPEDVLKSGRCLQFSTTTIPDSVPPCVWPQYEFMEGEDVKWGYDIEIWEEFAYRNSNKKNQMSDLIEEHSALQDTRASNHPIHPVPRFNGHTLSSIETTSDGISATGTQPECSEDDEDDEEYADDDSDMDMDNDKKNSEMVEADDASSVNSNINCEALTVPKQEANPVIDVGVVIPKEEEMELVVDPTKPNHEASEQKIESNDSVSNAPIPADQMSFVDPENGIRRQSDSQEDLLDEQPASKRLKIENNELENYLEDIKIESADSTEIKETQSCSVDQNSQSNIQVNN